jgi:hypothetical protein
VSFGGPAVTHLTRQPGRGRGKEAVEAQQRKKNAKPVWRGFRELEALLAHLRQEEGFYEMPRRWILRSLQALITLFLILSVGPAGAHQSGGYYHDPDWDYEMPDWMAGIPDDRRISRMSIPGTHDTKSMHGDDNVMCQSLDLVTQLESGIRALDIRLQRKNDLLEVRHGPEYLQANFNNVLDEVVDFLEANASETVLIRIKENTMVDWFCWWEGGGLSGPGNICPINTDRTFIEMVDWYLHEWSYYGQNPDPIGPYWNWVWQPTSANPTLGEVRGKIVILDDFSAACDQTVDSGGDAGLYTSLALDVNDKPHFSYYDAFYRDLMYTRWTDSDWVTERVDDEGDVGRYTSLALDGNSQPHISYHDATSGDLKYAHKPAGSDWVIETVDSGGGAGVVGLDTSLALYDGKPHISYHDASNGHLKYARWTGSAWEIQTADDGGNVGGYTSLALDAAGNPYISYWDVSGDDLRMARHVGGSGGNCGTNNDWWCETADDTGDVGRDTSLALDASGNPHISYHDATNAVLKYAHKLESQGEGWWSVVVDSVPVTGGHTSLVLDGSGQPHISYYDFTNVILRMAEYVGSSGGNCGPNNDWSCETADDMGDVGGHTSLALDTLGQLHIGYYGAGSRTLKYAHKLEGEGWWSVELDSRGDVGLYTSLALDVNDKPHFSYYDATYRDLMYARWTDSSWVIERVDDEGDVGKYTSLALDEFDQPHISYCDSTNGDLKYAHWNGSAWDIQLVDGVGVVGLDTSLALHDGKPHISYHDASNGHLKYAHKVEGDVWDIQTVDDGGTVGGYTSLALDAAGNPYISYWDGPNDDLRMAKYVGESGGNCGTNTDWWCETADSGGDVGRDTSLALDEFGQPHISYHDATNGFLKYAHKLEGEGWWSVVVDSEPATGGHTSLALDESNQPHISYYNFTDEDLKYARKLEGEGWDIQTVDDVGNVGLYSSLALDKNHQPHISYHDFTNQVLKYTRPTLCCGEGEPIISDYGLKYGYPCQYMQDEFALCKQLDLILWKWPYVKNTLMWADQDASDTFYINYLSGSKKWGDWCTNYGPVYPWFVASGHDYKTTASHRRCTGRTTGDCADCPPDYPSDCAGCWPDFPRLQPGDPHLDCNPDETVCDICFEGTNELALTYLQEHPPQGQPRRWGIIMADFPGGDLIDYIISANHPPEVTAALGTQACPHGDEIRDVTFTATDIVRDTMTAATTDPLPDTLTLTDNGCTTSGGIKTCEWVLEGTMDQPAGNYDITVTVTDHHGGTGTADTSILVFDPWLIYLPVIFRSW